MGARTATAQDVLTFHNDAARSGVQANETLLTPANVRYANFGKTLSFAVDGDVYAQTLYVSQYPMPDGQAHNVLFVATAHDVVYAFDADGKNPAAGYLWKQSLLPSGETYGNYQDVRSTDIKPDIGIIGTPVIDRAAGVLYAVSKSKTTGTLNYYQRLHALSLADGTEKLNGPTLIQASVPGTGDGGTTDSFAQLQENQRPALLLAATPGAASARAVLIAWASHGDNQPYHGWVIGYNAADISQQTLVFNTTPNGSEGGIWMSANGLSTDGNGNFFAAVANGTFDANTSGPDYGDSLLRLNIASSNLAVGDWFTPSDQSSLSGSDLDFGVSGPTLLPDQSGPVAHLLVTSDKTGQIYLANRDNMGHYAAGTNNDVQDFSDGGYGIHSNLVFFNNMLYLAPDGGPVEAWVFSPTAGTFNTSTQSQSSHLFGTKGNDGGGSNLTISAQGAQNGVLWAIDYSHYGAGPAVLYAFDPANLATEYYDSTQAANGRDQAAIAVKFTSPTVANGRVYIGGRNAVTVYGLLSSGTASAPSFNPPAGSYSSAQSVAISSATPAATIYYTTDGSQPTHSSPIYSAPIAIASTTTVKALAAASGYTDSAVASAAYTITGKTNPTITWATPAPIRWGSRLSGVQLDATANVAGTFSYSPAAGTVLSVGMHTLTVTFTPSNPGSYNTVTKSVTLTVNKANPALSWATPASIQYGTRLSATQLDCKASISGIFTYSPPAGTLLSIGTHTLSVKFVPRNSTDFANGSKSVTIVVHK